MIDFIFHFSAMSVMPFWIMMIFFPKVGIVNKIIQSPWIILPPTICYLMALLPNLDVSVLVFQEPSAHKIGILMGKPWGAALFWAYAGAFDLFVGRWIFLDNKKEEINHIWVAPILFVCIFFGPLALAMYGVVRSIVYWKRRLSNTQEA